MSTGTETPEVSIPRCSLCDQPRPVEWWGGICDRCYSFKKLREDTRHSGEADLKIREARWLELCPEQYRLNDEEKIDRTAFEQVTSWRLNPHGLLCMGDSQLGKSTSCWRLFEILYVLHAVPFLAITEAEFSQKLSRTYRDSNGAGWLMQLCNVPVLFFDDIGHAASTSRHLEDLYFVVEKRTAWRKPIIATTQFRSDEFISRAGAGMKTIKAILNRLNRACTVVKF